MFNWRAIPFVRLILPLIVGIILAYTINLAIRPACWVVLLLTLALMWLNSGRLSFGWRWLPALVINVALLLLGYQIAWFHQDLNRQNHFQQYLFQKNTFEAQLIEAPLKGKWLKMHAELQQISDSQSPVKPVSGNVLLYLENDSLSRSLSIGDRVLAKARLSPVKGPANPYAFDYRRYLATQNIHYQAFIRSEQWHVLKKSEVFSLKSRAHELRQSFINTLNKQLPTPNERAVGQALILGFKGGLTDEIRNAYAGTGAMHVLAVSGLHVGLVYLGLGFLLSLFPFRSGWWKPTKVVLLLGGVWLFALLTGASPSVMRASTMFSFLIIGMHLRRQPNIYNVLAASAFCLLCFRPLLLWELGFQLSYLAVIGIVYFQPKIYRLWLIDNKIGDYLWKLVAVAIAAQITTLPLSIYYFHQFPIYFWLSGIVVIPAATLILTGGLLLLVAAHTVPALAAGIGGLLYGVIWLTNSLIFIIQQIPGSLLGGIWVSGLVLLLLYGIVSCVCLAIETKRMRWLTVGMGLLLLIGILYNIREYRRHWQKQMSIYQLPGHTMLEFVDGREAFVASKEGVSQKEEEWAALNHRQVCGIQKVERLNLSDSFEGACLRAQNGLYQFYELRVAVVSGPIRKVANTPVSVRYLVLNGAVQADMDELLACYQPDCLVVDGSSGFRHRQYWRKACLKKSLRFHDVQNQGAIVLKM